MTRRGSKGQTTFGKYRAIDRVALLGFGVFDRTTNETNSFALVNVDQMLNGQP